MEDLIRWMNIALVLISPGEEINWVEIFKLGLFPNGALDCVWDERLHGEFSSWVL